MGGRRRWSGQHSIQYRKIACVSRYWRLFRRFLALHPTRLLVIFKVWLQSARLAYY